MAKHNKLLDILGTLLLILGFSLAFLPHAAHISLGLKDLASHTKYVVYGILLVIIALGILIYNNNALKNPIASGKDKR